MNKESSKDSLSLPNVEEEEKENGQGSAAQLDDYPSDVEIPRDKNSIVENLVFGEVFQNEQEPAKTKKGKRKIIPGRTESLEGAVNQHQPLKMEARHHSTNPFIGLNAVKHSNVSGITNQGKLAQSQILTSRQPEQESAKNDSAALMSRQGTIWGADLRRKSLRASKFLSEDDQLRRAIDELHPRQTFDNTLIEYPLCTETGRLVMNASNAQFELDSFGIAISSYFKFLKSFGLFFIVCYITAWFFMIPIFWQGPEEEMASVYDQKFLLKQTIGNLGATHLQCQRKNFNDNEDEKRLSFICPEGRYVNKLLAFGSQPVDGTVSECHQIIESSVAPDLDLSQHCNIQENAEFRLMIEAKFTECGSRQRKCDIKLRLEDLESLSGKCPAETSKIFKKKPEIPKGGQTSASIQTHPSIYFFGIVQCLADPQHEFKGIIGHLSREQIGIRVVIVDVLILALLLSAIWFHQYFVRLDTKRHRRFYFETKQYSVIIRNLPYFSGRDILELKAKLWEKIVTIIEDTKNQTSIRNPQTENHLVNISFAMSNYHHLRLVDKIMELQIKINKLNQDQFEKPNDTSIQSRIDREQSKMNKLKDKFERRQQKDGEHQHAIAAFVHFRSMDGVQKFLYHFQNENKIQKFLFKAFPCCCFKNNKEILSNDQGDRRWLKVEEGIEPEFILWENFGVSRIYKFFLFLRYALFVVAVLSLCFYIVSILEVKSNEALDKIPDIVCPSEYPDLTKAAEEALLDYETSRDNPDMPRSGAFHCFCRSRWNIGIDAVLEVEELPEGKKDLCINWQAELLQAFWSVFMIGTLILLANVFFEFLIQYGSKSTRVDNEQEMLNKRIRAISWIQFINIGIILFVISVSLEMKDKQILPSIFSGSFKEISSLWYLEMGYQIMVAMTIEILQPHFIPVCMLIWHYFRRQKDRGCSCSRNRTKKRNLEDRIELYTGPEFSIDSRLAQIVAFVWVTFFYSPCMPVVFLVTAINFFTIYWIDKIFLLRFYRRPKNYDETCINFSLKEMRWAFFFHLFMGLVAFSNISMFTSEEVDVAELEKSWFGIKRYRQKHVRAFFWVMAFLIFLSLFERTVVQWVLRYKRQNEKTEENHHKDEMLDFYKIADLSTLVSELEKVKLDLNAIAAIQNKQDWVAPFRKNLENKEQELEKRILELAKKHNIGDLAQDDQQLLEKLFEKEDEINNSRSVIVKSKMLTYDIKLSEEHRVLLEFQDRLLEEIREKEQADLQSSIRSMGLKQIMQRQSSNRVGNISDSVENENIATRTNSLLRHQGSRESSARRRGRDDTILGFEGQNASQEKMIPKTDKAKKSKTSLINGETEGSEMITVTSKKRRGRP